VSNPNGPKASGGGRPQWAKARHRWLSPPALRTAAWVVFITVLVWIWADLERPSKTENIEVWVKVVPATAGAPVVTDPAPGADGLYTPFTRKLVRFTLRGPQGKVKEFARELRESKDRQGCVVKADSAWQVGKTYTLNTLTVLNDWSRLREAGLTAEAPSESSITVKMDRWVELPVKVAVRTTDDDALAEKSPEPTTVDIRVLSANRDRLGTDPVIQTEVYDVAELAPGESKVRSLWLIPAIAGVEVSLVSHRPVKVTFRRKEQARRRETKSRKVEFLAPLEVWQLVAEKGYLPQTSEKGIELILLVPREGVDVEAVRVFVAITAADAQPDALGKAVQREVTVILPPGVELAEKPPPVDVKLYDPSATPP